MCVCFQFTKNENHIERGITLIPLILLSSVLVLSSGFVCERASPCTQTHSQQHMQPHDEHYLPPKYVRTWTWMYAKHSCHCRRRRLCLSSGHMHSLMACLPFANDFFRAVSFPHSFTLRYKTIAFPVECQWHYDLFINFNPSLQMNRPKYLYKSAFILATTDNITYMLSHTHTHTWKKYSL